MERDEDGFAAARAARARGAERVRDLDEGDGETVYPIESIRDRTALEVAIDNVDQQIAGLQEAFASVAQRLGPVLRESYDDLVDEWTQLTLERGASPLAQQLMDRADSLGRLVLQVRTMYGRIDL